MPRYAITERAGPFVAGSPTRSMPRSASSSPGNICRPALRGGTSTSAGTFPTPSGCRMCGCVRPTSASRGSACRRTMPRSGRGYQAHTLTAQRDAARQELAAALVTASKLVDPAVLEPEAGETEPVAAIS